MVEPTHSDEVLTASFSNIHMLGVCICLCFVGGGVRVPETELFCFQECSSNHKTYACYPQELRLKNMEASSKAAARCARESIAIRELLEPTPFLLSQVCENSTVLRVLRDPFWFNSVCL